MAIKLTELEIEELEQTGYVVRDDGLCIVKLNDEYRTYKEVDLESVQLWSDQMDYKYKQKELRKIKDTYSWIRYISYLKESEYENEHYHSKEDFHEQLERIYKHLDVRVALWGLDSYKKELQMKMTDSEICRMKNTNREMMIALLLDGAEDKEKTLKRALALSKLIDDGGASEEAMIHYNIDCPYHNEKDCKLKKGENPNRNTCVMCKAQWLDRKVDD